MYAIISDGGRQFKVTEGQILDIDYREALAAGEKLKFERVLAVNDGQTTKFGAPLVDGASVMAIDFEVIHFGDPSFDSAFLLNHLVLKSFHRPQWAELYEQAAAGFWGKFVAAVPREAWIEPATLQHLGWLMLARVDGKSPAEYLRDAAIQDRVRRFARDLIISPPDSVAEAFGRI